MARKSQEKALQQAALRAAEAAQQPTEFEPLVVLVGDEEVNASISQLVPGKKITSINTHTLTTTTNVAGDA